MTTFRGFIAVEIPVNDKIQAFHDKLSKLPTKIKLVQLENIHITLKFLGETKKEDVNDIQQIMKKSVQDITPWKIRLQGTGVFPNRNYIKIIWIGIQQIGNLGDISKVLNQETATLGYKKENRGFKAHITIGRVNNAVGKNELIGLIDQYKDTIFNEILVDEILLKKSTLTPKGPIYETISTIPLS